MKPVVWIPVLIALAVLLAGFGYVGWSKSGPGAGLYSRLWQPDTVFSYWNPKPFYKSVQTVEGLFKGEECIECHESLTPGIVKDWRASKHAKQEKPVYCSSCHGSDHQSLHMPTPDICANCHKAQHDQFLDERRYGFPSHALAMERALDSKHFADKPKAEVASCLQCHSVATKCDSCHTRHRFDAAEARRPEACITCHSGPPHPDDEAYFASAHGKKYLTEGDKWDWSKALVKGNYPAPTCAYCHMRNGKHQVADKAIWKFGLKEINQHKGENVVKRQSWIAVCMDCHKQTESEKWLRNLDLERKRAWQKLYKAEDVLEALRGDGHLSPAAGKRPHYPIEWIDKLWPRARIGLLEGQASAFYNVSKIERDYFEMWYFANLRAYKGAAHGAPKLVDEGHKRMREALKDIKAEAQILDRLGKKEVGMGKPFDPKPLWTTGEYTSKNAEAN
ncbi:MAG: hydroxylamine oxidoreductase [bacterium]|nr:hydroxylamine oxidoreductase [bacterium]